MTQHLQIEIIVIRMARLIIQISVRFYRFRDLSHLELGGVVAESAAAAAEAVAATKQSQQQSPHPLPYPADGASTTSYSISATHDS